MKHLRALLVWCLVAQLAVPPVIAQPIIIQQDTFRPATGGRTISNLRLVTQSSDGTEAVFAFDYTYDGLGGLSALILPVVEKRDQKGISAWFGVDPVTVAPGRGPLAVKIKYFNDEPGVPLQFTTDRIRMYFLDPSGTIVIGSSSFLRTVRWGSATGTPATKGDRESRKPAESSSKKLAREEARRKAEAEAKRLAEEKRVAE